MKVYVITKGDYFDYHICGVAVDKNMADKIAEGCSSDYDEAMVEVYDTEMFSPILKGGSVFFVRLTYDNNEIESCEENNWDYVVNRINKVDTMFRNAGCFTYVVARDEEHARKIGADILYQYKYEKETYGRTIYDEQ